MNSDTEYDDRFTEPVPVGYYSENGPDLIAVGLRSDEGANRWGNARIWMPGDVLLAIVSEARQRGGTVLPSVDVYDDNTFEADQLRAIAAEVREIHLGDPVAMQFVTAVQRLLADALNSDHPTEALYIDGP